VIAVRDRSAWLPPGSLSPFLSGVPSRHLIPIWLSRSTAPQSQCRPTVPPVIQIGLGSRLRNRGVTTNRRSGASLTLIQVPGRWPLVEKQASGVSDARMDPQKAASDAHIPVEGSAQIESRASGVTDARLSP